MKVYVVLWYFDDDPAAVIGVFKCKNVAQSMCDRWTTRMPNPYVIEEWEVL